MHQLAAVNEFVIKFGNVNGTGSASANRASRWFESRASAQCAMQA